MLEHSVALCHDAQELTLSKNDSHHYLTTLSPSLITPSLYLYNKFKCDHTHTGERDSSLKSVQVKGEGKKDEQGDSANDEEREAER